MLVLRWNFLAVFKRRWQNIFAKFYMFRLPVNWYAKKIFHFCVYAHLLAALVSHLSLWIEMPLFLLWVLCLSFIQIKMIARFWTMKTIKFENIDRDPDVTVLKNQKKFMITSRFVGSAYSIQEENNILESISSVLNSIIEITSW